MIVFVLTVVEEFQQGKRKHSKIPHKREIGFLTFSNYAVAVAIVVVKKTNEQ